MFTLRASLLPKRCAHPANKEAAANARTRKEKRRFIFVSFLKGTLHDHAIMQELRQGGFGGAKGGNHSVTGAHCYEWRSGLKAKRCPGLEARPVRWNPKALGSSWRGRGPRPPAPHFGEAVFSSSLGSSRPMLPARTARTPRPQQNLFRTTRD